ncbi:MAG TPA: hypothetical protein PKG48_13175, partial [Bacteroidales bacterium]|nr:hypothetical protein [Bacteroidales bacterium]
MSGRYFLGKASRFRFFLVVGAFLLLSGSTIAAEYRFDDLCRAAYREVLCLRFTEAQRLITEEKRKDPGNPVPAYLENYIDFLTLVIGEEPGKYQELKENRTARIRILEAGPGNSPYHDFLLGEVYLQWAIARLKFRDYTTAAWEIRKAYSLFTGNATRFPSFRANKVGLGVVRVVIGLVPAEYRWIVSLSGMEGSLRQGISDIRDVAAYSGSDPLTRMYRPQALFYLAFLTVNFEKDKQEALNIPLLGVGSETGEQPFESPLLIYARAVVLMRNGLNDKALEVLEQRKSLPVSFPFCYLDYLEGTARINRLDPGASLCFEKYVSKFRGITYIRSAYHKMAWAALL